MSRTIAEWQQAIGEYADDHGWWEPQCKHLNIEATWSREGDIKPQWCLDCGAHRDVADDLNATWSLPHLAQERNEGELMMLFVTECAEAFEEIRNNHDPNEVYYHEGVEVVYTDNRLVGKPEGPAIEVADIVIRILDYCAHRDIDLEAMIALKHEYNLARSYRHGGKTA